MAKAKKRYYNNERRDEARDFAMLSEDRSAVANMPQQVVYRAWPRGYEGERDGGISDTITGIDDQMGADARGMRRERSKSKY